jgi:modulator of FtsH protease HflC
MKIGLVIGGAILAIAAFIGLNSLYVVGETQQALVLQFGAVQTVKNDGDKQEAGLHVKIPFVQNVVYFDKRNLGFDTDSQEVVASDQERLIVDAFVRWRIDNPLTFYQRVRTEANARDRLAALTVAALRAELGDVESQDIVSGKRSELMGDIRSNLNAEAAELGISIIDVRIKRADLPPENSQRVFTRMQTERQQAAAQIRAEGEEQARRIRAEADRAVTVTVATATEESEKIRGDGDAQRNAIYARVYSADPEFFSFYRSMQAYENSFEAGTPIVISPDSEFFRYFGDQGGRR